ncbi:hypothetical protein GCM10023321_37600 [Pseudonocardia eucalypti]|uniref:Uncharacterized protein n=1 Tax=Pseudonocardia eucalypti TaxID=648755 RepID=A0ABP9Q837_9PSEU
MVAYAVPAPIQTHFAGKPSFPGGIGLQLSPPHTSAAFTWSGACGASDADMGGTDGGEGVGPTVPDSGALAVCDGLLGTFPAVKLGGPIGFGRVGGAVGLAVSLTGGGAAVGVGSAVSVEREPFEPTLAVSTPWAVAWIRTSMFEIIPAEAACASAKPSAIAVRVAARTVLSFMEFSEALGRQSTEILSELSS